MLIATVQKPWKLPNISQKFSFTLVPDDQFPTPEGRKRFASGRALDGRVSNEFPTSDEDSQS
ncbi:Protein of unknown function [Pyronema omphalodes CBS 100304]|uniref:Uncharacterized protein n=1 Tax=Pyronema omphalodes (strain CBS 100304) TaxID=1076935 RepID=U4L223_PYROM|nr:Protein of unknown function [Pyronema omphalodes CBS 100304]